MVHVILLHVSSYFYVQTHIEVSWVAPVQFASRHWCLDSAQFWHTHHAGLQAVPSMSSAAAAAAAASEIHTYSASRSAVVA